jgi:hypothetical protein
VNAAMACCETAVRLQSKGFIALVVRDVNGMYSLLVLEKYPEEVDCE